MATFIGDSDDNTIRGGAAGDLINGMGGNDILFGRGGDDLIEGGDGNDILRSGNGNDVLDGGNGNDRIFLFGSGKKTVDGGDGFDTLHLDLSHETSVLTQIVRKIPSSPFVIKTREIYALDWENLIKFKNVERLIYEGSANNDIVYGTSGDDIIYGNDGADTILTYRLGGRDTVYAGNGNDNIISRGEASTLFGEAGNDRIRLIYKYDDAPNIADVDGGEGVDTFSLVLQGGKNKNITIEIGETMNVSTGQTLKNIENLSLQVNGGNNTIHLTPNKAGSFHIKAGIGHDHAIIDFTDTPGKAGLRARSPHYHGTWEDGEDSFDVFLERLDKMTITGNDHHNVFLGYVKGSATHVIYGGKGNDIIRGGSVSDQLFGGRHNDRLSGNGGDDLLDGGLGKDSLQGGDGDDQLLGRQGDDLLFGENGKDVLIAGKGNDILRGGNDADTFVFKRDDNMNEIVDFEVGTDLIDLSKARLKMEDLVFVQMDGFTEITFAGATSPNATTIEVVGVAVAELDDAANFLF